MIPIVWSLAFMVGQSGAAQCSPQALIETMRSNHLAIQSESPYTSGWISSNSGTQSTKVGFTVGVDASNHATSLWLFDYYRFPHAPSLRAIEDWLYARGGQLRIQSYLNRTLVGSIRLNLAQFQTPAQDRMSFDIGMTQWSREHFNMALDSAIGEFGGFERWVCVPNGGERIDQMAMEADPSDLDNRRLVDYLDLTDLNMLIKGWGWENKKSFGFAIQSYWVVAAMIDGRQWKLHPDSKSMTALILTADLKPDAKRLKQFESAYPAGVEFRTGDSPATVSLTIELRDGVTLGTIKKRILDFVHEAEKLGPATP